jgi:hypothetical protein
MNADEYYIPEDDDDQAAADLAEYEMYVHEQNRKSRALRNREIAPSNRGFKPVDNARESYAESTPAATIPPASPCFHGSAKMSRTRTGYATTPFACPLVGRTGHLHLSYTILIGQTGEESARAVTETDCSAIGTCPIATHRCPSTSFDLSRCAFAKSQNAQSWVKPQADNQRTMPN